jgi:hypothetical protein
MIPSRRTEMTETKGAEAARELANYVNAMGHSVEDFVEQLTLREHRTLQQRAMALFLGCIEAWADRKEHGFDLRNEDTVKLCRRIKEALAEVSYGLPLHKLVRHI